MGPGGARWGSQPCPEEYRMPSLLGCSPPKFLLLLFLGPSQAFGLFTRVWVSGPHSIFMSAQCPCRLSLIAPHLQFRRLGSLGSCTLMCLYFKEVPSEARDHAQEGQLSHIQAPWCSDYAEGPMPPMSPQRLLQGGGWWTLAHQHSYLLQPQQTSPRGCGLGVGSD